MNSHLLGPPHAGSFHAIFDKVLAFATKDPAQSLAHRVCLEGSHGRPQNPYTQVRETLVDVLSEDAIAIMDEKAVGMIARQGFPELLQRPFRRGMGSYVLVDNLAGIRSL